MELVTFPSSVYLPDDRYPGVFVFGANTQGVHGAGAAKIAALHYDYPRGVHDCLVCTTKGCAYGISVKQTWRHKGDLDLLRSALPSLRAAIDANKTLTFNITAIGTGLGGLRFGQVAAVLRELAQDCTNTRWDDRWLRYLRQ